LVAIIESTFEVGRRFRCTMRIDCGRDGAPRFTAGSPKASARWTSRRQRRLLDELQ
jgi:hypothetical protein